jgi:hypothetical protein
MILDPITLVFRGRTEPRPRGPISVAPLHKMTDAARAPLEIGFWDPALLLGDLRLTLSALSARTPDLRLYVVQAPAPAGYIARPERVNAWSGGDAGDSHLIADHLQPLASRVSRALSLDYIIVFSPAPIAATVGRGRSTCLPAVSKPPLIAISLANVFDPKPPARGSLSRLALQSALPFLPSAIASQLKPALVITGKRKS